MRAKDRHYRRYVVEFLDPSFPFDIVGITIFARAYKCHVAIFVNHQFWTTEVNHDFRKIHIILAYCGGLDFQKTRMMHSWEYKAAKQTIDKYQRNVLNKLDPDSIGAIVPSDDSTSSDSDTSPEDEDTPQGNIEGDDLQNVMQQTGQQVINERLEEENIMPKTTENTSATDTPKDNIGTDSIADPNIMPNDDENLDLEAVTENTSATDMPKDNIGTDSIADPNIMPNDDENLDLEEVMESGVIPKAAQSKPSRISKRLKNKRKKEKEIENLKLLSTPKPTKERRTKNSMKTGLYSPAAKSIVDKRTPKGSWNFTTIALKDHRKKQKARKFKCSVCQKEESSVKALNKHLATKHKKFKFKCRRKGCGKQFQRANTLYRHKLAHKGLRYFCTQDDCDRGFLWKHELDDHIRSHTGKDLYKCGFPPCKKGYPTARARQRHEKLKHPSRKKMYKCNEQLQDNTKCDKEYPSEQQLNQHKQGIHWGGFKAKCGKTYTWPYQRAKHQKECTVCKSL